MKQNSIYKKALLSGCPNDDPERDHQCGQSGG